MAKPDAPPPTALRDAIPGAGGVVFDAQGSVLLLRHRSGPWVFPKGHIDPGESALEAALREVEEESGIRAVCPDPGFQTTTRYVNNRREARVVTWFPLLATSKRLAPEEAVFSEAGFFRPPEAERQLSFEEDRRLLNTMLEWWRHRPEGTSG